jgi:DNA-directed RNA polymerase specialized sigma24 family protein
MISFHGNQKGSSMTNPTQASPDRSALVYRYHERLYRLALLTTGNADTAAILLQQAYRELPSSAIDEETLLVRALLPKRPPRWRWSVGDGDLGRSMLEHAQASALLRALARLAPAERLVIGLAYLSGSTPDEIAAQIEPLLAAAPLDQLLVRFRAAAARALGLVANDADEQMLAQVDRWLDGLLAGEESIAMRRAVLEQPIMRDLRDGMIAVREVLPRALPALFAIAPPRALTERLLKIVQHQERPVVPNLRALWAQGGLALGVLALAAAIILLPSLAARNSENTATARAPDVAELIESAIHRFDRPPLQAGVLHEQYLLTRSNGSDYLIERWYDYGAPNRLAISVRPAGSNAPPLMQLSSDGRSLVQFRNFFDGPNGAQSLDVQVSEAEARAIVPLLRGQPTMATFGRERGQPGDLGPLYLAQARAAGTSLLGTTTLLGRQAFLLTYHTEQPPTLGRRDAAQPAQVVLAIDAQTYALLDVSLIAEGAAESSARHPIQAQQLEVLADAPDEQFRLPTSADVSQHTGIASVRFPFIVDDQIISLDDAARRAARPLLAPSELPDERMRGLAVAVDNRSSGQNVILLYEGEFQNLIVLPDALSSDADDTSQERSAGDFRYQIVRGPGFGSGLAAVVYRPNTPDESLTMILNDEYATSEEREATLQRLIASLTPVDVTSLPTLRRNFEAPDAAAGGE